MLANVSQNGSIGIVGVGSYVPERVMTNDDLSKLVETSDEWITERTGIKERHIAEPGQAAGKWLDRAFEVLAKLVDGGWQDRAGLETDPDLDAVRKDKRFGEVLKRLEAQKPEPGG